MADVVEKLSARIAEPEGPPLPEDVKQRERKRLKLQPQPEPPPVVPATLDRSMAYRGFRGQHTKLNPRTYVPPEGANPQAVRQAKLAILLEDGTLTPDLVRQLPPEDQQWIEARLRLHREQQARREAEAAAARANPTTVLDRLSASIADDTPLPEAVVPPADVGTFPQSQAKAMRRMYR